MKPVRLLTILCLLLMTAGSVSLTVAPEPAGSQVVRLGGEHLQVGVDKTSGQLVEFVDLASRHNFAGSAPQLGGLWQIELANRVTLTATNARRLEVLSEPKQRVGLGLRWSEFDLPSAPGLSVDVLVRLETNFALSRWQIQVHNTGGLGLSLIRFPRLLNIPEQPRERLAVPVWLGQELENPRAFFRGPTRASPGSEWSYPGLLSMQCLALTSENGPGLYVACDDAAGQLKNFAVFGSSNAGFNIEIVHQPETDRTDRDSYVLPYSVTLGSFSGDWFSAATLYRAWATNQSWALDSRLKRGLVPAWTTNTALWIWNRGPSPGVLDPAIALQEKLGLPVSVFWHWWHGCAYDAGFPEYLPPREGMASFQAALAKAQARDIHAIVYMNQRLWGMATASWTNENAARFAVKAQDGQVKPEVYNTFTKSPCASMCMGTEFWRNKYAGLAARAINELGVDGIYMDQACSSLACFDPAHGHTIGGGTYWMSGFKLLASDIRRGGEARRAPALAGEGCGENWLPYLDLMLALQVSRERYAGPDGWETIPFFHAVYHGYGVFYGNYSSLTLPPYDNLWPSQFAPGEPLQLLDQKFSRQFYLEQARAFVWGQQPTTANFLPAHLKDRPEEIAYVLRLAKIHAAARPYLLHGELLAPLTVDAPVAELVMSRLSIYAGQQDNLKEFRKTVPQVLATAWRAPDGTVGIAVASISDQPSNPSLRLSPIRWALPPEGRIYQIDERGRREVGQFRRQNLVLKPHLTTHDACLLELLPSAVK